MPAPFTLRVPRLLRQHPWLALLSALVIFVVEPYHHVSSSYPVVRPEKPLDPPFVDKCLDPLYTSANTPRQSAALVMLARNSDVEGAVSAIRSLETHFNRWFNYPYVFLNNEPWSEDFKVRVTREISSSAEFAQIPSHMWDWSAPFQPSSAGSSGLREQGSRKGAGSTGAGEQEVLAKRQAARANWARMDRAHGKRHGSYLQNENYHHMCRFNSGFFFDVPELRKYKWYWRLEPDVLYTCAITYDPFAAMTAENKTYGYTMALWEVGSTAPSLFRAVADYAKAHYPDSADGGGPGGWPRWGTWNAMHDASWAAWPLRRLLLAGGALHSRNRRGDAWNFCHFWSNFEIADMDFFRGRGYRRLFEHLDGLGGFHGERWGDAPVHSLAAALMLEPRQLHYFRDIGYGHPPFAHCPKAEGLGCRCECEPGVGKIQDYCLNRVREPVEPAR